MSKKISCLTLMLNLKTSARCTIMYSCSAPYFGITSLATWFGLTVSPIEMWSEAMIDSSELVSLGLLFGAIVMSIGLLLEHRKIKSHFTFTYMSFGFIVFGMASLGGLFRFDNVFAFFMLTMAQCALGIYYARKEQSFFFLLMSLLFGYVALTYFLGKYMQDFTLWALYLTLSGVAIPTALFKYKSLLRK